MTTWLILRTSGILVLGLLTIAVGLGIAGPSIRDPRARLVSVTLHRTAAVTGTVLLLAHVSAAVLDSWVDVSAASVVVPGISSWQPLWVGLGALAFDAVLLLIATSALRRRSAKLWWNVHVISYVAYALAWLHAVGVGSDRAEPVMLVLAVGSAAVVGVALIARLAAPAGPRGVGLPQQQVVAR